MSEVIKERDTFFVLTAQAAAYAAKEGRVSEKKLAQALDVRLPTAA